MIDLKKIILSYSKKFSEKRLMSLLKKGFAFLGVKVLYSALLLFYAYQRSETPIWAKNIILGTLGYLISPIDMLPDLTPVLGYTDDLGVLSFGLVTIASYVNIETKEKAKEKMNSWFPTWDKSLVQEIDDKL